MVSRLIYGRKAQGGFRYTDCSYHSNSLSNKIGNSLLAVRDIIHKYIVVGGLSLKKIFLDWIYMFQYSWSISRQIFLATGLQIVLDSIEPFILLIIPRFILDELTGDARWEVVLQYIVMLIGAMALIKMVRLVSEVVIATLVHQSDIRTGLSYAKYFLDMDYSKLEDEGIRDLQRKVASNVHPNLFVYQDIGRMLTGLFQLIGYSYLITDLHPMILIFVFVVVGLNYWLNLRTEKNRHTFQTVHASAARRFDYLFHTMIDFRYAGEIRMNQISDWLSGKSMKIWEQYRIDRGKYDRRQIHVKLVACVIDLIQMLMMYGYAVYQALRGLITIGNFSVYIGAILNFSRAFVSFAEGLSQMVYLSKYVDDYKEYISLVTPSHKKKGVSRLPKREGRHMFEFQNVSFQYPNTKSMILKNLSITISDNQKLAIIGKNGTGKTTFIKLLCRLYEPTEGVIRYNGTDISTIRYEDYIRLLSVVFQDFRLFAFSVKDNIILNRTYEEERFRLAVSKAGLDMRLKSLPHGAETAVSKEFDGEGVEFSGGEGQKLVTARAYYKEADVVIMDEPTSALDSIAEQRLYKQFGEIMEGKVAIFISHRLASTRFCDRIAVFEDGTIKEYGTHDELMEQKGLYYEMFCRQAEYYREEARV